MDIKNVVITGAVGQVGGAYVCSCVAAGYNVRAVDKEPDPITVWRRFWPGYVPSPGSVDAILSGEAEIDPFYDLTKDPKNSLDVPLVQMDLSQRITELDDTKKNPFHSMDAAILCAANPDPYQSSSSAALNTLIDLNSLEAALSSGVKLIIYTSSNCRTMGNIQNRTGTQSVGPVPSDAAMPMQGSNYAKAKNRTIELIESLASTHRDTLFIYNDHCWIPRDSDGQPPQHISHEWMQFFTAEWISQQAINCQLRPDIYLPEFVRGERNLFEFVICSRNEPMPDMVDAPRFPYDLSGIETRLRIDASQGNIYTLLSGLPYSYRRIPRRTLK